MSQSAPIAQQGLNTSETLIMAREPKFLPGGDCSIQKGRGFNQGIDINDLVSVTDELCFGLLIKQYPTNTKVLFSKLKVIVSCEVPVAGEEN